MAVAATVQAMHEPCTPPGCRAQMPRLLEPSRRHAVYIARMVALRRCLGRICSVLEGRAWMRRGSGKGEGCDWWLQVREGSWKANGEGARI